MAVDFSRYEKFLEIRNNAISIIEGSSVHHETKGVNSDSEFFISPENGGNGGLKYDEYSQEERGNMEVIGADEVIKIRHVGVIKDQDTVQELERLLQEWTRRANELSEADPIRFPKTAFILAPVPQVIYGVQSMSISVGGATTSKKYTKQSLLARYDRALKLARQGELVSHNSVLIKQLVRERGLLAADSETIYRVRNKCGTETICTVTFNDGTVDRVRVPRVGVAFATPPHGEIIIRKPRVMSPRGDSIELLGVEPLDCSLSGLAGFVYRESEIIKAKANYALNK